MRSIAGGIRRLATLRDDELYAAAKELRAPYELVAEVAASRKLPVVLFTAACRHRHPGRRRPDDAARRGRRVRRLGHLSSGDPARRARAIVEATTYFSDPAILAKVSRGLGEPMVGLNVVLPEDRLAGRGW